MPVTQTRWSQIYNKQTTNSILQSFNTVLLNTCHKYFLETLAIDNVLVDLFFLFFFFVLMLVDW